MRWDERLGTLVIDHGGEAVFVMPPDEFAAFEFGETFKLRDTTFMPWIERVHAYEA